MSELPAEVNEADLIEQRAELDDDVVETPGLGAALFEVDEADALEQRLSVPVQDDEYPDA